jgi:hypothetical protein
MYPYLNTYQYIAVTVFKSIENEAHRSIDFASFIMQYFSSTINNLNTQ